MVHHVVDTSSQAPPQCQGCHVPMTRFLYIAFLFNEVLIEETPSYQKVFSRLWNQIRKVDIWEGPEPTQVIPEIQKTWGVMADVDLVTNEDYIVATLIQVETATRYEHPVLQEWLTSPSTSGLETMSARCWEKKINLRGWIPEPVQQQMSRFRINMFGSFLRNPHLTVLMKESRLPRPTRYCKGVPSVASREKDYHWEGHRKNAKTLSEAYKARKGLGIPRVRGY